LGWVGVGFGLGWVGVGVGWDVGRGGFGFVCLGLGLGWVGVGAGWVWIGLGLRCDGLWWIGVGVGLGSNGIFTTMGSAVSRSEHSDEANTWLTHGRKTFLYIGAIATSETVCKIAKYGDSTQK